MKTNDIEIDVTYKGSGARFTFTTGDNLEDAILTFANDEAGFDNTEDFEELTDLEELTYEVVDWGEVEDYENLQDIDVLNEIAEERDLEDLDWDVISAAIDCDIEISNIVESYEGRYKDDEDFAYETALSFGFINNNKNWPHNCIDWEQAARELMSDYTESNGYYFRNV